MVANRVLNIDCKGVSKQQMRNEVKVRAVRASSSFEMVTQCSVSGGTCKTGVVFDSSLLKGKVHHDAHHVGNALTERYLTASRRCSEAAFLDCAFQRRTPSLLVGDAKKLSLSQWRYRTGIHNKLFSEQVMFFSSPASHFRTSVTVKTLWELHQRAWKLS